MQRDERKEYTEFVNTAKKLLRKGSLVSITGLEDKDQQFFDAATLEPQDGAYCD